MKEMKRYPVLVNKSEFYLVNIIKMSILSKAI